MGKLTKTRRTKIAKAVPAVCSAVLPGLGQLVNGDKDKAIGVAVVAGGACLLSGIPIIGGLASLALFCTWVYGIADGYLNSCKKN